MKPQVKIEPWMSVRLMEAGGHCDSGARPCEVRLSVLKQWIEQLEAMECPDGHEWRVVLDDCIEFGGASHLWLDVTVRPTDQPLDENGKF